MHDVNVLDLLLPLLAQIDTDQNPSESHNQMNQFD
jgi:hypothetical protein